VEMLEHVQFLLKGKQGSRRKRKGKEMENRSLRSENGSALGLMKRRAQSCASVYTARGKGFVRIVGDKKAI